MLVNGKSGNLISIRDRGLLYGDGVFRTLRAVHGRALHWSLHYQKLENDCAALGIVCPDIDLLTSELDGLLEQHPNGVLKLVVTRGQGVRGYAPPPCARPTHLWDISPLPEYPLERYSQGINAHLCEIRLSQQPRLAGIKHLNRLENVLAAAEWNDADIAEGIMLDVSDNVIGGTRSNLFIIRNGEIQTPDLSLCGVAGIQRERVIAWAARQDSPCRVVRFGIEELFAADAVFLVNSVIGLWPVRKLQAQHWKSHSMVSQLQEWLKHASD